MDMNIQLFLDQYLGDDYSKAVSPYLIQAINYYKRINYAVTQRCSHLETLQVICITFLTTIVFVLLWQFLFKPDQSLVQRTKKCIFRFVKKLPFVKQKIESEMAKTSYDLHKQFHQTTKGMDYIKSLPKKGLSKDDVLSQVRSYKKMVEVDWSEGRCSGVVYSGEDDLTELMAKVYGEFAWSNPLHADVFPDVRKMEAEVVRMTIKMFQGTDECCGTVTSGGTESIMLACKAYRDLACEQGIQYPEMLVPITVHAAFDKAAQFFRMKITHIPIDNKTRQVNVAAMKRAMNKNVCMLVGSAPQFPHGIVDDIVEIGKLGKKYNKPVHVDSCLGGFLVPFMKKAGYPINPFDFSVDGVTSISADTHKFGFAPKGSSVIMYSSSFYRKYQYFTQPDWTGGIYASPTFAGSRSGAIIAACWATMMYIGEQGYIESTNKIVGTTRYIEKRLRKMNHIYIFGEPKVCVVGLGSDDFNIYRLLDALTNKGWNLNALQFPSSIHICVTLVHTKHGIADQFLDAVEKCIADIMEESNPKSGGQAAMYGMAQSVPDRSIVGDIIGGYFDAYYSTTHLDKPTFSTTTIQNGIESHSTNRPITRSRSKKSTH